LANSQIKTRVEDKALSAKRMGCCLLDEGFKKLNARFCFRIRCIFFCVATLKGDARMIRSKSSKILSAQNIALLGMLMAMQLILTRFLAIERLLLE